MNKRERVMVLVCLLVVAVFGVPMLLPAARGNGGSGATVEQVRARAARSRKEAARLESEIRLLEPQVRQVAWTEPPAVLSPRIVKRVAEVGRKVGVSIPSIRPTSPRALDVVTEVPVQVNVTATFPTFVRFLYALQDPQMKLSLDRVRISSTNAETDEVSVELEASAYTTYQMPATTARPTGATGAQASRS